jgi:hypothetical protein
MTSVSWQDPMRTQVLEQKPRYNDEAITLTLAPFTHPRYRARAYMWLDLVSPATGKKQWNDPIHTLLPRYDWRSVSQSRSSIAPSAHCVMTIFCRRRSTTAPPQLLYSSSGLPITPPYAQIPLQRKKKYWLCHCVYPWVLTATRGYNNKAPIP